MGPFDRAQWLTANEATTTENAQAVASAEAARKAAAEAAAKAKAEADENQGGGCCSS